MLIHTHAMYVTGVWEKVDDGVGLNQYDPFLPHARYMHTGAPLSENRFVIFGGCARYTYVYTHVHTYLHVHVHSCAYSTLLAIL